MPVYRVERAFHSPSVVIDFEGNKVPDNILFNQNLNLNNQLKM